MKKNIIVTVYDKATGEITVDNKRCNEIEFVALFNKYSVAQYEFECK